MISYGIPTALMIIAPITNLAYQTARFRLFEKNRKESPIYDQAWISALIILLASQMVDVQYFDGRISIIMWFYYQAPKIFLKKNIVGKSNFLGIIIFFRFAP